jgi:cytochrome oxidase assembly protein ShyY1
MQNVEEYSYFTWVYFIIALICILMYFLRRNMRLKEKRKQQK